MARHLNFDLSNHIEIDPKCLSSLIIEDFIASNREASDLVVYFIEGDLEADDLFTAYFKVFDRELRVLVAEGKIGVKELEGRGGYQYDVLVKFKEWNEYVGLDREVVKQCMKVEKFPK